MTGTMQLRMLTQVGPKTTVQIYATVWTARECDRLIEVLTLLRDWLREDEAERAALTLPPYRARVLAHALACTKGLKP